jgi:hypothetical protein
VTIDWHGIKWFCLGMAAGIACHRNQLWAWAFVFAFVIAAGIERIQAGEDTSK